MYKINKILYMLDNADDGCTIKEAIEALEEYPEESLMIPTSLFLLKLSFLINSSHGYAALGTK